MILFNNSKYYNSSILHIENLPVSTAIKNLSIFLLNENLDIVKQSNNPLEITVLSLNNKSSRINLNKIYFNKELFKFDLD